MSLVSQQQLYQNQLQMKQLDEQRQKQAEQTRSFQSQQSSAQQKMLQRLRSDGSQATKPSVQQPKKKDPSDPLCVEMPTNANPTETLAQRFNMWRTIIGALIHYLKETVSVHEEVNRQQIRLQHAITFPFVTQGTDGELYQPMRVSATSPGASTIAPGAAGSILSQGNDIGRQNDEFAMARKFFLPLGSGSIQDLPTVLYQYHAGAASLALNVVRELNNSIIPRLEDLRRDLLVKIKEIRGLQSDFKNNVNTYAQQTRATMKTFQLSIQQAKSDPDSLNPKNDPYLLKYTLDRQIKKQLTEENYLHEAFINIQTSGKELEKVVYIEIQTALTVHAKLMGQQAQNVFDGLISRLDTGVLTKDPAFEWDSFVSKDTKDFIDLNEPMRHASEIRYKHQTEPLTYQIRSGYLERKSKYLKSYARGWYVLTPCFLHEFKSPDRKKDPTPIMSIALSNCQIAEHSRKDERNPLGPHKFVIKSKQGGGLLHKGHNYVLRVDGYDEMMNWYGDLKRLTQMPTPSARSTIAWERRRSRRLSSTAASVTASTAASLASASYGNPGLQASNSRIRPSMSTMATSVADTSSMTMSMSMSHQLSPTPSVTSRSIDTTLMIPKSAPGTVPPITVQPGKSQLTTPDVVVNVPSDQGLSSADSEQLEKQPLPASADAAGAPAGTTTTPSSPEIKPSTSGLPSSPKSGKSGKTTQTIAPVSEKVGEVDVTSQ